MNRTRSAVLAACLCIPLSLGACKPSQSPEPKPTMSAAPEAKPGIALTGLRIILPRVSEHPAALYFTLANTGAEPARLVAVFVDGATKADMHETSGEAMKPLKGVDLAPSETVTFAPGGKHVMLSGIPGTWKPGDDPDVTLTFADGDKISAKAAVEKSRSADELDARSGMKM